MLNDLHILNKQNFRFYNDIYLDTVKRSHLKYLNGEHHTIGNGRNGLKNKYECDLYTALYGGHHYYKLINAFENSKFDMNSEIELIDYGCGQAFASIILLEYLFNNNINLKKITIKLVDISDVATNEGINNLITLFKCHDFKNHTISKHILNINSLGSLKHLNNSRANYKIHLFSNILDITTISLKPILQYIISNYCGKNYFICTSPNYPGSMHKMKTLQEKLFNVTKNKKIIRTTTETIYGKYFRYVGGKKMLNGPIKRVEHQFILEL